MLQTSRKSKSIVCFLYQNRRLIMQSFYAARNTQSHAQGNRDNDHIVSLLSQEISWYVSVGFSTGWAALILILYMHTILMIHALTCSTRRHAFSRHISPARLRLTGFIVFFFHRKLVTCVIHGKTHRRKKAALASAKTFMWLSCHNRKHLEPVEQMLGEDLTEARGHKSDTVSSSQAPCYDNTTRQILLLTHL